MILYISDVLEGDTLCMYGESDGRIVWQPSHVNCLTLDVMCIIIAIVVHIIWRVYENSSNDFG